MVLYDSADIPYGIPPLILCFPYLVLLADFAHTLLPINLIRCPKPAPFVSSSRSPSLAFEACPGPVGSDLTSFFVFVSCQAIGVPYLHLLPRSLHSIIRLSRINIASLEKTKKNPQQNNPSSSMYVLFVNISARSLSRQEMNCVVGHCELRVSPCCQCSSCTCRVPFASLRNLFHDC